jgi:hypothetical protein
MFRAVWEFMVRVARVAWTLLAIIGLVTVVRFFWTNRIEVVQREITTPIFTNVSVSSVTGADACNDLRTVAVTKGDTLWELIKEECNVPDSSVPDYLLYNTGKLVAGTKAQICCSSR